MRVRKYLWVCWNALVIPGSLGYLDVCGCLVLDKHWLVGLPSALMWLEQLVLTLQPWAMDRYTSENFNVPYKLFDELLSCYYVS